MSDAAAWSMPPEAFWFLNTRLDKGATVVELGSGEGTARLVRQFKRVVSVEHDPAWVGRIDGAEYVHAPIADGWYDVDAMTGKLPEYPDAVIVDGPPGTIGRQGLYRHLELFGNAPMLIDDVHRRAEMDLAHGIAMHRKAGLSIHFLAGGRAFATIGWDP
jgi:hypothetical protein